MRLRIKDKDKNFIFNDLMQAVYQYDKITDKYFYLCTYNAFGANIGMTTLLMETLFKLQSDRLLKEYETNVKNMKVNYPAAAVVDVDLVLDEKTPVKKKLTAKMKKLIKDFDGFGEQVHIKDIKGVK